jgi:hypothetical protein
MDPPDLLFSLYSMTTWEEEERLKPYPDYSKDCRTVYIDMAGNDPFDVTGSNLKLPSWVLDWRRRIRLIHFFTLPLLEENSGLQYDDGNMLRYSGGDTIKSAKCSESTKDPGFLYMEGFIVDKIDRMGTTMVRDQSIPARGVQELDRPAGSPD